MLALIVEPVMTFGVVPPIAGGEDKSKAPPRVKLPDEVTVPDSEMPLTVPVPETDVTVPTLTVPPRLIALPLIVIELLASMVFVTTPVPPVFTSTPATLGSIEMADPAAGDACNMLVPLTAPAKVIWLIPAKLVLVPPSATEVLPMVTELLASCALVIVPDSLVVAKDVIQLGLA